MENKISQWIYLIVIAYLLIEIVLPWVIWQIDRLIFGDPDKCPLCGSKIYIAYGKWYCLNKKCERFTAPKSFND